MRSQFVMYLKLLIILISSLILCATDQSTVEPPLENVHRNESSEKPLIVRSIDNDNGLPKETQMAQCTITSGDIKASAQATFSKKLEGFCSTKDMTDLRDNLVALESRLHNELYDLRIMIRSLLPQSQHQDRYRDDYYYRPYQSYNEPNYHRQMPAQRQDNHYRHREHNNIHQTFQETSTRPTTYRPPVQFKSLVTTVRPKFSMTTERSHASTSASMSFTKPPPEVVNAMKNKLKSLDTAKPKSIKESTTQEPSTTTIHELSTTSIPLKNEYTYYWKLDNFPKVFNHAKKSEIFSHVFNVKGLFLRIRAALQFMENQNLILDIEHLANIENLDKMEIEISDGLVFKEIAEEKLFQYSFGIMDQSKPDHDLISPVYWNTETDNFLVPNSVHLLANYIKNDSLLIKLIITF